jgi:hypothetical protein
MCGRPFGPLDVTMKAMKYPSLQKVNPVVIDGRSFDHVVRVFLTGALLALANHFDGHVLVIASSDRMASKFEAMGEQAGLDFFFHAESVRNSAEFLELCAGAGELVMLSSWPTQRDELTRLRPMKKRLLLSEEVARTCMISQEAIIVKAKELNAVSVMALIMHS